MSAHFSNESPRAPQSAICRGDRGIRIVLDPVKYGVGEHRVKLLVEGQLSCVHDPGVKSALAGGCNHVGRTVHTYDICAGGCQLFGQHAIAATEIENALSGLRIEQVKNGLAERGYKSRIGGVS